MMIQVIIIIGFCYVLYHYGLFAAMAFFAASFIALSIFLGVVAVINNPKKFMK